MENKSSNLFPRKYPKYIVPIKYWDIDIRFIRISSKEDYVSICWFPDTVFSSHRHMGWKEDSFILDGINWKEIGEEEVALL